MSINVQKNEYRVEIDSSNPNYYLPADIGLTKGDVIVFEGAGSPVRFPAGNVADKVPVTDPTSQTGWILKNYNEGGGGGGSGTQTITLVNNTGATIPAGTIVTLDMEGEEREIKKAIVGDKNLFITADNASSGSDVECYSIPKTICNVLCADENISVGDLIGISETPGIGTVDDTGIIGIALTEKELGDGVSVIKVLLKLYSTGDVNYTISDVDLEDGVSPLPVGHLYFYYEPEEEEEP